MKNNYLWIIPVAILFSVLFSCEKNSNLKQANAKIIGFNKDKCGCCWGWIILIGKDTIKSDDVIIGETIGYEIIEPINVYIELGQKKEVCSSSQSTNLFNNKDYYKINKIEKKDVL